MFEVAAIVQSMIGVPGLLRVMEPYIRSMQCA
jgi:hypothetical protein